MATLHEVYPSAGRVFRAARARLAAQGIVLYQGEENYGFHARCPRLGEQVFSARMADVLAYADRWCAPRVEEAA